jgi:type II secretory pathway pseudopilin PulG
MDISSNKTSNIKGYTTLETIIVIIIISIIVTVMYFNWPGEAINLQAQAKLLAHDIRYTQNLSMTKGERYRLVITSSKSYSITNSSGNAIVLPSGLKAVTLGAGITFGTITNLPNKMIVFNSQGIPYIDATLPGITLETFAAGNNAKVQLTGHGETMTVTIVPSTGAVTHE